MNPGTLLRLMAEHGWFLETEFTWVTYWHTTNRPHTPKDVMENLLTLADVKVDPVFRETNNIIVTVHL